MKKGSDWVVMKGDKFWCARCGELHAPKMPIPIDDFLKKARGFEMLHSQCKPREEIK